MILSKDPLNVIITGVGGQGNVLASQLIGRALVKEHFYVTIGETYGSSQRGGAVMSHMRISREAQFSPLIPEGQADIIVSLEPVEALRILSRYGNPGVSTIVNCRPIHPVAVTVGDAKYPSLEEIEKIVGELSPKTWFVDATQMALAFGSPIFTNIIMVGALAGTKLLPLSRTSFEEAIRESLPSRAAENLKAFAHGFEKTEAS